MTINWFVYFGFRFHPQVKYRKDYEKTKDKSDYNTLPATENPLLRQLRYAGTILSDVGVDGGGCSTQNTSTLTK